MVIQNQLKYLHLISVKRPVFCVLSDGHRELKAVRPHCGPGQEMRCYACVNGAASAIMELISEQSAHNCR